MFSKIQDSLRFIVTVDASLGLGSAVRENGKKRGEIAKKKKQQQSASEATISFSRLPLASIRSSIFHFTPCSLHCGAGSQAMLMHTMVFGPYQKRHQMV